jgi:hypothetical protein
MKKRCDHCAFGCPMPKANPIPTIECRFDPPRDGFDRWPTVSRTSWCGKFAMDRRLEQLYYEASKPNLTDHSKAIFEKAIATMLVSR